MKSFSMFKLSTSILAFAALVMTTSLQAASENGKAVVKLTKGNPTYSNAETKLGIVKAGLVLTEGTTITTGPASIVELDLGENGKVVQIIENTTVTIDELKLEKTAADTKASTHLTLQKGGLLGNVKKLSAASDFKVKYAEGVAGIRGTKWAILPGRGVICSEGTVTVTFVSNGKVSPPVTLAPGQVALPPLTPGGAPVIVSIPVDTAMAIVNFLKEFLPDGLPGERRGGNRDNLVIVSANSGDNRDTSQGVIVNTGNPGNNE